jgi:hypothetical protein
MIPQTGATLTIREPALEVDGESAITYWVTKAEPVAKTAAL